jgi:adenosylmethionine-8-amino-7-oxononanoate aminotransferase
MQHTSRVSPCYPYRYQLENESEAEYAQRLADELEQEILRVGEGKVAAFFAETGKPCDGCLDLDFVLIDQSAEPLRVT